MSSTYCTTSTDDICGAADWLLLDELTHRNLFLLDYPKFCRVPIKINGIDNFFDNTKQLIHIFTLAFKRKINSPQPNGKYSGNWPKIENTFNKEQRIYNEFLLLCEKWQV